MKNRRAWLGLVAVVWTGCFAEMEPEPEPGPGPDPVVTAPTAVAHVGTVVKSAPAQALAIELADHFEVARLDDRTLVVGWSDLALHTVRSGLLDLERATFVELPPVPRESGALLSLAVGGPASARRVYFAWVSSNPRGLVVATIDPVSRRVTGPRTIAPAVNVSTPSIAGSDRGAVIGYLWPSEPAPSLSYDPWLARLDLDGELTALELVDNVASQTFDVTVAAWHGGEHAIAYSTSERKNLLRRYDAAGVPPEPAPVDLGWHGGGYDTWLAAFSTSGSQSYVLLAGLPVSTAVGRDFVVLRGGMCGPLVTGERLGEAASLSVPALAVAPTTVAGQSCAAVAWQEVLARDPDYQGCLEPPPIHLLLRAQVVCDAGGMKAVGPALDVLDWRATEPGARPPENVRIVPAKDGAVVLWREAGTLRLRALAEGA